MCIVIIYTTLYLCLATENVRREKDLGVVIVFLIQNKFSFLNFLMDSEAKVVGFLLGFR